MDNYERNAHFQDSARQVSYKILDLGLAPLSAYSRDDQKLVAEIIAQYAYDLVYHALYCNGVDAWYRPGNDYHPTAAYERKVTEHVNEIPDLTEWPKTASE